MYEERLLVDHLTLQLPPGTPLHERGRWSRRAASALDAADLTPRGLPPRALLVVRRLADPRPGVLLDQDATPWQAGARWGSAAREAMDACWRNAARPLRGPVPAHAPAVWFADRAEWLACLSVDLHYGMATQRWWWRTWLSRRGRGVPGEALVPLWVEEARWVPPALALLAEEMPGVGAALVGGLPPAGRERVRAALVRAYALPSRLAGEPVSVAQRTRDVEEWSGYIPGGPGILPGEPGAGHLLALALALYHAPAAVGAGRREQDGSHTDKAAPAPRWAKSAKPDSAPSPGGRNRGPATVSELAGRPADDLHVPVQETGDAVEGPAMTSARHGISPARKTAIGAASSAPGRTAVGTDGPAQVQAGVVTPEAEEAEAAPPMSIAASHEMEFSTAGALEAGLRTNLGGVFYLINVLIELNLLSEDGTGIGSWERLALLAQAFLPHRAWRRGHDRPCYADQLGAYTGDPLWGALAALAGVEPGQTAAVRRWLVRHLPPITRRLAQAVPGGDIPGIVKKPYRPSRQRALFRKIAAMLRQPAVLYITRTHIDVFLSLEQIDIAVRRAGLDRDPGWVPELGRVIALHFE